MQPALKHMPQLDGLRALSVSAVAWAHWRQIWHKTSVISYGDLGVETFFVISGFLITGILLDNRSENQRLFTLKQFYIRRMLRIFPLFYGTLVVTTLLNDYGVGQSWVWLATYTGNFFFYLNGWLGHISHFWSLAVEEQFYLFWPLLMILLPDRFIMPAILGCIITAPVFELGLNHLYPGHPADLLMPSCMDALGIGALAAYGLRHGFPMKRLALGSLLIGLALCAVSKCSDSLRPFGRMGEDCALGWLVYTAATGFRGPFGWLLEFAPVNYLGKISYGLYIIHAFAISICVSAIMMLGEPEWLRHYYPLPWFRISALTIVTVGLASLSWHLFEKPINDLKRKFPYPAARLKGENAAGPQSTTGGTESAVHSPQSPV